MWINEWIHDLTVNGDNIGASHLCYFSVGGLMARNSSVATHPFTIRWHASMNWHKFFIVSALKGFRSPCTVSSKVKTLIRRRRGPWTWNPLYEVWGGKERKGKEGNSDEREVNISPIKKSPRQLLLACPLLSERPAAFFRSVIYSLLLSLTLADDRAVPGAEHCDVHDADMAAGDRLRPRLRRPHAQNVAVSQSHGRDGKNILSFEGHRE